MLEAGEGRARGGRAGYGVGVADSQPAADGSVATKNRLVTNVGCYRGCRSPPTYTIGLLTYTIIL